MKKVISIWSFAESDLKKCMILAKDAGFEGIELALDEHGPVSMDSTKEDIEKIKSISDEVGIELFSLASGLYWTYNYTSANEENVKKRRKLPKNNLRSHHGLAVIQFLLFRVRLKLPLTRAKWLNMTLHTKELFRHSENLLLLPKNTRFQSVLKMCGTAFCSLLWKWQRF